MSTGDVIWPLIMSDEVHRRLSRSSVRRSPSSVRRVLFGPIDHEENRRFVRDEMKKIQEQCSKRWNFDFDKDRPLPGKYSWTAVSETTGDVNKETPNTVQLQVKEPVQQHQHSYCTRHASLSQITDAGLSTTTLTVTEVTSSVKSTPATSKQQQTECTIVASNQTQQTKITDFMKKRKHSGSAKTTIESSPKSKVQRTLSS